MIININYKLQNSYTPKTLTAQNKPPVSSLPQINEISNICYQPVFTARKKEMPDEEFELRLQNLKEKFGDSYPPETIVTKESIEFAEKLYDKFYSKDKLSYTNYWQLVACINKSNLHFANKMISKYKGPAIDHYLIRNLILVLPYVNKENEHIARGLCWNVSNSETIEDIMTRLNSANIPLVERIMSSPVTGWNREYAAKVELCAIELDNSGGIRPLAELCRNCYDDYEEEALGFPDDIIPFLPVKYEPETLDLFRKIYETCDYDTAQMIFRTISPSNMELVKWLQENPKEIENYALDKILTNTNKNNNNFVLNLFKSGNFTDNNIMWLSTFTYNLPAAVPLLEKELNKNNFDIDKFYHYLGKGYFPETKNKVFMLECGIDEIDKKAEHQKKLILKHPEKYLNNDDDKKEIENDYFKHEHQMMFALFDKETLDIIFRKRYNKAGKLSRKIRRTLNYDELSTLKKAFNCTISGKSFTPQDKLDLTELVCSYKSWNMGIDNLKKMVKNKEINIKQLKLDMLKNVMRKLDSSIFDFNSDFSDEKMLRWNIDYINLLDNTYKDSDEQEKLLLKELITTANSSEDFKKAIHKEGRYFGIQNLNNKKKFEELGLDYEKWLNPSKKSEVHFISVDKNTERLKQIADQLTEDIETLRKTTTAKKFIDKQLKHCIKNDKFEIPKKYYSNRENLIKFINGVNKQLEGAWKKADKNLKSGNNISKAKLSLTMKNHIEQRLQDAKNIKENVNEKPLDITIKMWDRNPQKDLFQGNYSTCCIGMGEANASAMPVYLMDTAFNMIELVDNNSGKTIGNALCYFVKNNSGQPELVIDNVEIRNSAKVSSKISKDLREAIKKYAVNITKSVAGKKLPVWLGQSYNDITDNDLPAYEHLCTFAGDVSDVNYVYLDAFGGWTSTNDLSDRLELYRLSL